MAWSRVLYRRLLRPALFRLYPDAEDAHERAMAVLARASRSPTALALLRLAAVAPPRPVTCFGLSFPNPLGLAGGFDKDARALHAWPALGFGFVEVGTVTAHAQPGNPRPRVFRLPEHRALINRLGFNNAGAAALADRLAALPRLPVPLGISLGKSKVTPLADATEDYLASFRLLHPHADYFAINVSSPNTPDLRRLQDADHLATLLAALKAEVSTLGLKPILVKVAPDLTDSALDDVLDVCTRHGVDGVIAGNTTVARPPGLGRWAAETGGLSGPPLQARAVEMVTRLRRLAPSLPLIGVGGISDPGSAQRMLDAGANLLQAYTGFVYGGPRFARRVVAGLTP